MRRSTWGTCALCAALALIAPSLPPEGVSLAVGIDALRSLARAADAARSFELPQFPQSAASDRAEPAPMASQDTVALQRTRTRAFVARKAKHTLADRVDEVADTIMQVSLEYDFEPELLLALIQTESSFRPAVRSRAGAIGLMQLLPGTGRAVARDLEIPWEGATTLTDPVAHVRMGAHYLSQLRQQFDGDQHLALSAYNLGPSRVRRYLRKGKRPDWYAGKVEAARRQFAREFDVAHENESDSVSLLAARLGS